MSVVLFLFGCKYERQRKREKGRNRKDTLEQKESDRDRKKRVSWLHGSHWHPGDPFHLVFLVVKVPQKHRILWVNIHSDQVTMSRYVPPEGAQWGRSLATDSGSVALPAIVWCKASGEHSEGSLIGLWHPLSCLSHDCPMVVACGVGSSTAGPVCVMGVMGDNCLWPEVTPETSSPHHFRGQRRSFCKPAGCGVPHPKFSQGWLSAWLLSLVLL